MSYSYRKEVPYGFEEAVEKTTAALKDQGFGVLTTIDVQATLKEKLGVEFAPYTILGACNPPLAHQALQAETEVGLLLPCNVIVYRKNDQTVVSALLPSAALQVAGNPALQPLAAEAEEKLKKALDAL